MRKRMSLKKPKKVAIRRIFYMRETKNEAKEAIRLKKNRKKRILSLLATFRLKKKRKLGF